MTELTALAARARDTTLSDEQRYAAVMTITAKMWRRKMRLFDVESAKADQTGTVLTAKEALKEPDVTTYRDALSGLANEPTAKKGPGQGKPRTATAKDYVRSLLCKVAYRDSDGRPVGHDYDFIRMEALRAFPNVTVKGRYYGKPTSLPIKELHEMATVLNAKGVRLPFRPRRKTNSVHGFMNATEPPESLALCAHCGAPYVPSSRRDAAATCSERCRSALRYSAQRNSAA
jgi:hypothetical protein